MGALSALLQKLSAAERRVFGALLAELGVESLQQLETEVFSRQRENEAMRAECRTHIALLESKRRYGRERLAGAARALEEQGAARGKAERRLGELRARAETVEAALRALDERLEAEQRAVVAVQRRLREEEGRVGVLDARIREARAGGRRDA